MWEGRPTKIDKLVIPSVKFWKIIWKSKKKYMTTPFQPNPTYNYNSKPVSKLVKILTCMPENHDDKILNCLMFYANTES